MSTKDRAKEKEMLQQQRDTLNKTINSMQEEVLSINRKIRSIENEERAEALKKIGIKEGSAFIGFAKNPDYHYIMIFGFKVLQISKDNTSIFTSAFKYRCDDDDYSLHFSNESYRVKVLSSDMCNDYRFYSVNDTEYMELLKKMATLSVTRINIDDIEKEFKSNSETVAF